MLSEADEPRPKCVCCVLQTWSFNTNYPRAFTFCEQNCLSPLFTLYHVSQRREGREGDSFTKQGGPRVIEGTFFFSTHPLLLQRIKFVRMLCKGYYIQLLWSLIQQRINIKSHYREKERRRTPEPENKPRKTLHKNTTIDCFFVKKFVLNRHFNHITPMTFLSIGIIV